MPVRTWMLPVAAMFLASSVLSNTGFGQDACGPDGCGTLFSDAGQSLTSQLGSLTGCGEGCTDGCCDETEGCFDEDECGITFGGWWQGGYTSESTGMFNNIPDRFNTHQSWLYAEKIADGSGGTDWGFRADVMYGIDSADTQAFGNDPGEWDFINGWDRGATYGWALPQAYLEVACGDLSVKAGHFYTLLGYEVVTAPDNFFFSHSLTMFNSEAFTHTGALATYNATDDVTLYGGWTAGWDTGFNQWRGGSNFLGGFSVPVGDDATFTYITTIGDMGIRGEGYSHSMVLDVAVNEKLNYVVQSDLVGFDSPFVSVPFHNDEIGLNQYLFYTINDHVGLGTRVEWWASDSGFNHGGQSIPLGGTRSYYEATFGVNLHPSDNIVIRPEYRHDWFPHSSYSNNIFAVDVVISL